MSETVHAVLKKLSMAQYVAHAGYSEKGMRISCALSIHDVGKIWYITLCDGVLRIGDVKPDMIEVTLSLTEETLCKLVDGSLDAEKAVFMGRIRFSGNMKAGLHIGQLLKRILAMKTETRTVCADMEERLVTEVSSGVQVESIIGYQDTARKEELVVILLPDPCLGGGNANQVIQVMYRTALQYNAITLLAGYRSEESYWIDAHRTKTYDGLVRDTCRIIHDVQKELCPQSTIQLVGYSLGAYIAERVTEEIPVEKCFAIAPPLNELDGASHPQRNCIMRYVFSEHDAFCDVAKATSYADTRGASYAVIPDEDHFFCHSHDILAREADAFFRIKRGVCV